MNKQSHVFRIAIVFGGRASWIENSEGAEQRQR
jgi:hypothetical protein